MRHLPDSGVTPPAPSAASGLERLVAATPPIVIRFVLAIAFLGAAWAALRSSVDLAKGWLPEVGAGRPVLGLLLGALGALLLVGWRGRSVAFACALLVLGLLALHLRVDRLYDTATHLLPWALCATALLAWEDVGALALDGRRPGGAGPARPDRVTFVLRVFLGSIFVAQGWHDLVVVGPVAFARRVYVTPLAGSWVPEALLWLAGVTNPPTQLLAGLALVLGFRTRAAAAVVAAFLVTILFGHVLSDPLDRGPETHDYALANLLLALTLVRLGARGEAWALSGPGARRLASAAAVALVGLAPGCATGARTPPTPSAGVAAVTSPPTGAATETCRPSAREPLARARALVATGTLDDAWAALDAFGRAEALDPDCAAAPAEAAELLVEGPIGYSGPGRRLGSDEAAARTTALATRALRLDAREPRAHHALGVVALYATYDWCRARAELDAALAADPTRVRTRILRAYLSVIGGRTVEAEAWLEALSARPEARVRAEVARAVVEFMTGRAGAAVGRLDALLARGDAPPGASFWRGLARVQVGHAAEGVLDLEAFARASQRNPGGIAGLGQAYAAAGRPQDARAIVTELFARAPTERIVGYQDAGLLLALGDVDAALTVLEPAVRIERDNWPTWLAVDPRFRALHGLPRFEALVQGMALDRARACVAPAQGTPP